MGRKKISRKAQMSAEKLEAYCSQFPDWYWKFGLHDAHILSVSELELPRDWKSQNPRYNCLEITLDSSEAMHETDITQILLYNYEIKTPDIAINQLEKPWWLQDTLTKMENGSYQLEIVIETAKGKQVQLIAHFEAAEVKRRS